MIRSTILSLLIAGPALAAPPPVGSEDWLLMQDFKDWIETQRTQAGAWCCNLSDGRPLFENEWKRTDAGYQVFIGKRHWPDAPDAWIDVPAGKVVGASPLGLPVAWWARGYLYCFAPVGGV